MPRKKASTRTGAKVVPPAAVVLPQRSSSITASTSSISSSSSSSSAMASNTVPPSAPATVPNGADASQSFTASAHALLNASAAPNGDLTNAKHSTSEAGPSASSTGVDASSSAAPPLLSRHGRSSSIQKSVAVLRALSKSPSQDDDHYFHVAGVTSPGKLNGSHAAPDKLKDASSAVVSKRGDASGKKAKGRFPTPLISEKPRKVFHSSIGFLVLHLYLSHADLDAIVRGLSYFLGVVVTADVIRLNYAPFERLYEKVLGFLMRETEKTRCNGVVFYLIGTILTLKVFPEDIACVGIMTLSWADTAASLFGRMFGSFTPPLPSPPFASRKSLAGFIAAAAAGAGIAAFFWGTGIAATGERVGTGLSWLGRTAAIGGGLDPGATFGTAAVGTGWQGLARGFVPRPAGGLGGALADAASAASGAAQQAAAAAAASKGGNAGKLSGWFLGKASSAASGAAATLASASTLSGQTAKLAGGSLVPSMPLWLLSLATGVVAAVAESLELGGLDDNLTLPVLSAAGLTGVLYIWGRAGEWILNGSGASLVESVLGR
ncbi:Diacylglycerol kinase [Tilletia horrida]|nr:Diacylglycerol kinase [Tilletia horrida]